MSQTVWPLNENGEIVFSAGTGSTNITGYLSQDVLPSVDGGIPVRIKGSGDTVTHIKKLVDLVGTRATVDVIGYYENSSLGGGVFYWDSARPWTDHDGGTVIALPALQAWGGTQTTVSSFLSWTGAGVGCYVKLYGDTLNPLEFGAIGDGIIDDTSSIFKLHTSANILGCSVTYSGIKKVAVQANAQIKVNTNIDFAGCEVVILGGVDQSPSFNSFNTCYIVEDPATPVVTVNGAVASDNLKAGSFTPTAGLFDDHGYAELECGFQIAARGNTTTRNYIQSFKVNRFSRVSHPLSVDLAAFATNITVRYRKTSSKRLFIRNLVLTEGSWNNQQIIDIRRCNVTVEGVTFLAPSGKAAFDNVCEIIRVSRASDVRIVDYITQGRPVTTNTGSYNLRLEGAADIIVDNMNSLTGWGATGANFVNGVTYKNCKLNRVDAHDSGHNIFVVDSDINGDGVVYGYGGGVIKVTNCRIYNAVAVAARVDYSGEFFGSIIVDGIEVVGSSPSSVRYLLVDMRSVGASVPVKCPESVSVTNVTVKQDASNNITIIPLWLQIRSASAVVYAPIAVNVDHINAGSRWNMLMDIDLLNLEGSGANGQMYVNINECRMNVRSASDNGLLDRDSGRSPTVPVCPIINIANCTNIRVRCRNAPTARMGELYFVNCQINSVEVSQSTTNSLRVGYDNCDFRNRSIPFDGQSSVPLCGKLSSNGAYTYFRNCTVLSQPWDLSQSSFLIGNILRVGFSDSVLLPSGVTITSAFSGWRGIS